MKIPLENRVSCHSYRASATTVAEQASTLEFVGRLEKGRMISKAPIEWIPFDIITLIFIEASKQDNLAPLAIEQVCATWRSHILRTPRAWSYIELDKKSNPGIMLKYLARSELSLIHIRIPRNSFQITDEISHHIFDHASRIHKLEMHASWYFGGGWRVNSLKLLHIVGRTTPHWLFGAFGWEESRLEYLKITPYAFSSSFRATIGHHFAHLQHLIVKEVIGDGNSWPMFVEECCSKLKSLGVVLTGLNHYNKRPLQFPALERLEIEMDGTYVNTVWPFDATTPMLRSYRLMQRRHNNLLVPVVFHTGTERVIHMQTDVPPQLEWYPSLQCLHLSSNTHMPDTVTLKAIHAAARRLCKGFEALYLDDHTGLIVKDGGTFLYCVDEEENESFEVSQGCTHEMPFESGLF
ncbi:hypothetical protein M408DRAFT_25415 [Serendipita vermifera MAFF 305830]|uniref:F-box domain-containing protein n=1 Tax=Serendipita vermifera MAFF 305830 TaxID=933852 RepID=A0A0C3B4P6_SERVB|nr:hypothetical protein M408DRAFT_25415 [Serendipita vermifera MAFF 305830]